MSDGIGTQARTLIARHIHSVEQLEVLLLLRAAPEKTWTVRDVARALVSAWDTARVRLNDLEQRRFIERMADGWRYAPSPGATVAIDELAQAYATHRVTVVRLIFSKPGEDGLA